MQRVSIKRRYTASKAASNITLFSIWRAFGLPELGIERGLLVWTHRFTPLLPFAGEKPVCEIFEIRGHHVARAERLLFRKAHFEQQTRAADGEVVDAIMERSF